MFFPGETSVVAILCCDERRSSHLGVRRSRHSTGQGLCDSVRDSNAASFSRFALGHNLLVISCILGFRQSWSVTGSFSWPVEVMISSL